MAEKTTIHPNFLKYPELVEQRERAEKAINAYLEIGDRRCTGNGYGPWYLCVDVKVHKYPLECAPEISESKQEQFYEDNVRDFWELDFDGDCIAPEWCKYLFPEFCSDGRSGGYFVFQGKESQRGACAVGEYKRERSQFAGTIDTALCGWDDVIDPYRWIEDVQDFGDDEEKRKGWIQEDVDNVTEVFSNMADFFESATEWARVVKAQMDYRIECYEGKHWEALDHYEMNQCFEYFDFSQCTVELDGDTAKVSWPQYSRQWSDRGEWVECNKDDEGARMWRQEAGKDVDVFKKMVPGPAQPYTLTMTKDQLVEMLNEDLAVAVRAIRKRAIRK